MSQCTATIMFKDEPQVRVTWTKSKLNSERIEVLVDKPYVKVPRRLLAPTATLKDFFDFLETRCPPRTREDIEDILADYGLKSYLPLAMCRLSHGRSATDSLWIRFDDEQYTWNDIALPSRRD